MSTANYSTTDTLDSIADELFATTYGLSLDDAQRAAVALLRWPAQTRRALALVERSGYGFLDCLAIVKDVDQTIADAPLADPQEIAAALARSAAADGDTARSRAYNKAALHIAQGTAMRWSAGDLLVASGTRAGIVHRVAPVADGWSCSCEAARRSLDCWHIAAAHILTMAHAAHELPILVTIPSRKAA